MEEEGEIDLTEFREQAAKDRLRSQQISTDLTAQKLQNHVHTLFIPGYHIVIILFTSQSSEFPFYKLYLNMKEALHREVGQARNISFS